MLNLEQEKCDIFILHVTFQTDLHPYDKLDILWQKCTIYKFLQLTKMLHIRISAIKMSILEIHDDKNSLALILPVQDRINHMCVVELKKGILIINKSVL